MLVGDLESGLLPEPLLALDVRVHSAALDRSRPHDRNLDRDVLQRLRPGPAQRGHLGPALDLEHPGRVRFLDAAVGLRIVVGDPREVDPLTPRRGDHLHRALDGREHPEAEQVDLEEARVGTRVLIPLDDLAALHRRGDDRAAVDQRAGGDDHPAGVLGEVTGQTVGLSGEPGEPGPPPSRPAAGAERCSRTIRAAAALVPARVGRRWRRIVRVSALADPSPLRHIRGGELLAELDPERALDVTRPPPGRPTPRCPGRHVRSRPVGAPAPCPAPGSPRGRGRSGTRRRAPSGRGRSDRGSGG